jgi:hypothetical protein
MKKLLIAAVLAMLALFAGCASNGSAPALPTPQQLFSQACPIVNADLAILAQSPLLTSAQRDALTKTIIPANQGICSAGVQISVANLKAFHDSLLPAAIAIVQAVPAIPQQPVILLALQTFGPLVQQMIDGVIVAVASAATAPVAASTPLAGAALK